MQFRARIISSRYSYTCNSLNGNETYVGNVCIKKFIGIDIGNLFEGLKRIAKDINANVSDDLIKHAWQMGYLHSEKDYHFLQSIKRKRKLSEKQVQLSGKGPKT